MFISSGIGPYSGQAVHFQRAAPEQLPYAVNRYRREAERHYEVLDKRLAGRTFIVDRADVVFGGSDPLARYPHLKRWFRAIDESRGGVRARSEPTMTSSRTWTTTPSARCSRPTIPPQPDRWAW
jgi:GST-like protein